jgi:hypothetical protein
MRKFVVESSFNAVAAGGTASIDLPVGKKYHQLRIAYGTTTGGGPTQANMEAHIDEMRVKVNGKVQRTMSAAELFAINAYHGIAVVNGILPIFFSEPWRRTALGEDLTGWGTNDVETFQVEIDIDAAALTPTLSMTVISEPSAEDMGPIVKWDRFTIPVGAVGVFNHTQFPKDDAYYAVHNFSANIDDVLVRVDGEDRFDAVLADANEYYAQNGFTGQASMFHVDFGPTARVSDILAMVEDGKRVADFRVDYTMSAGTPFVAITETLGLRD